MIHDLIVEKCFGCNRTKTEEFEGSEVIVCSVYPNPANMWRIRDCLMATHIKREAKKEDKKRVGQQKQKKKI